MSNLVYNPLITSCEKSSKYCCVKVHRLIRTPPYISTEVEGIYRLESKWWLEDWKDYILAHNFYLYWSEPGSC